MGSRYRSGWRLEIKYWEEELTQSEIAMECDVSARTIRKYMDEFDIETRGVAGEDHPKYGTTRSAEVRSKISDALEGRTFDESTRERMSRAHQGEELSEERKEKISQSLAGITRDAVTRRRMSESTSGSDNPNWRGGYSRRYGSGWSVARDAVRERDEICQHCGHDGSRRRLEVHHIEPVRAFRENPNRDIEDAHHLENLVLLCRRCHGKVEHGVLSIEPPD